MHYIYFRTTTRVWELWAFTRHSLTPFLFFQVFKTQNGILFNVYQLCLLTSTTPGLLPFTAVQREQFSLANYTGSRQLRIIHSSKLLNTSCQSYFFRDAFWSTMKQQRLCMYYFVYICACIEGLFWKHQLSTRFFVALLHNLSYFIV